jgi:hypothetical protein
MNTKYNDVELAQLSAANKGVPTVRLFADMVRMLARTDKTWRGEAAKQLRLDLEHNNSGWCSVDVTKESYENGPAFVLADVEI